jgi:uncharacterized membrane protein YqaE (UPF0057 family)
MTGLMCFLIPPVGVAMKGHGAGQIILNIILTLIWWLPGMIHAFAIPDLTKQQASAQAQSQNQQQNIVVNVSPATVAQGNSEVKPNYVRQILELGKNKPMVTVRDVILETNLSIEKAEETLKHMAEKNLMDERVDAQGNVTYHFK